jgi:hypothetical protein
VRVWMKRHPVVAETAHAGAHATAVSDAGQAAIAAQTSGKQQRLGAGRTLLLWCWAGTWYGFSSPLVCWPRLVFALCGCWLAGVNTISTAISTAASIDTNPPPFRSACPRYFLAPRSEMEAALRVHMTSLEEEGKAAAATQERLFQVGLRCGEVGGSHGGWAWVGGAAGGACWCLTTAHMHHATPHLHQDAGVCMAVTQHQAWAEQLCRATEVGNAGAAAVDYSAVSLSLLLLVVQEVAGVESDIRELLRSHPEASAAYKQLVTAVR